ncbi:MAG: glycerol-3-phosphate responsive antiterminator [Oscillospiraceae bacterium]
MTNNNALLDALQTQPVVAAAKDAAGLLCALKSECEVVFVLYGKVADISEMTGKIKAAGKLAMIHLDLVEGLSAREAAVDFIVEYTKADGIISTKPGLIKYAKAKGLLTVQRFFVLDSLSLTNINKQLLSAADAVEILPGVMPKIIKGLCASIEKPIIAGGLITDKEDVMNALSAGAVAVSSTNSAVWIC